MLIEVRILPAPPPPGKPRGHPSPDPGGTDSDETGFCGSKIEILEDLDPQLPEFEFDPEQIKQVLLNLIKNAPRP